MKKLSLSVLLIIVLQCCFYLVKAQGTRQYYQNQQIAGQSEDVQGVNYLLLHQVYTGTLITDNYVMGEITAIRGGVNVSNRKWSVLVHTASAYNSNRGSIISYNEGATLVTLTYNGQSYLAVAISNNATLYNFAFTGWAQNQVFTLVKDDVVSNVQPFSQLDPVSIQGNVGIGNSAPAARFHVEGVQGTVFGKFTQAGIPVTEAYLNVTNATSIAGSFIPCIIGRTKAPGRPLGIYITGEAEDVLPTGADVNYAAVVLDGRNKSSEPLVNSNILAIDNFGQNLMMVKANGSVGIGTTTPGAYKLAVEGTIGARKVKVTQSSWADFVFDSSYNVPALKDVDAYIKANHHLPDMPSAAEVKEQGLDVGEMNKKLLQKVEELTIHLIEQQKMISELQAKDILQEEKIQALEENNTHKKIFQAYP